MLFAVVDQSGDLIARDLTTEQAAHEILTVDGQEYDIRPDSAGDYWTLWTRQQVANKPWTATLMGAYGTEAEARAEIFGYVVKEADGGRSWKAEAIPQADYDEMQAKLRIENLVFSLGADAVSSLACEKHNAEEADARYDGDVWIGGGQGRWLDTAGLNEFADWIETQQDNSWREAGQ